MSVTYQRLHDRHLVICRNNSGCTYCTECVYELIFKSHRKAHSNGHSLKCNNCRIGKRSACQCCPDLDHLKQIWPKPAHFMIEQEILRRRITGAESTIKNSRAISHREEFMKSLDQDDEDDCSSETSVYTPQTPDDVMYGQSFKTPSRAIRATSLGPRSRPSKSLGGKSQQSKAEAVDRDDLFFDGEHKGQAASNAEDIRAKVKEYLDELKASVRIGNAKMTNIRARRLSRFLKTEGVI